MLGRLRELPVKCLLPFPPGGVGSPRPLPTERALPGVMLSLLGPPTLLVSGGAPVVPQPGSKALALLAYLKKL